MKVNDGKRKMYDQKPTLCSLMAESHEPLNVVFVDPSRRSSGVFGNLNPS